MYYNSFLPSAIRGWNEISEETRNSNSISTFKFKLNSNIQRPPKYYNCGTRIGQIYHTRLRTSCSSLNQYLFSKNIVNSPSCSCGAIEDAHHFLFVCNLYTDLRRTIFQVVSVIKQPSLNLLLFGNQELANDQNKTVFTAVQEYIVNTKRFKIN